MDLALRLDAVGFRLIYDRRARVEHLHPPTIEAWQARMRTVAWAERHFPGTPIITCMARDKYRYMTKGDVLVDDREDHRSKWEDAGGIFVTHENAERSLAALRNIFPSIDG